MSRQVRRVPVRLHPAAIDQLPEVEIRTILRAADELIMRGGRTLLVKILRGSKSKEVMERQLDCCPSYGAYQDLSEEEVLARIDWLIDQDYLRIQYDYRLPLLVFSDKGWAIERETMATELLHELEEAANAGQLDRDMTYLKDRDRGMIFRLLELIEATGDPKYVPLLESWARVDYKKVRSQISGVIRKLQSQVPV